MLLLAVAVAACGGDDGAAREQLAGAAVESFVDHQPGVEIDARDVLGTTVHAGQHLAQGPPHRLWIHGASGDLREQRVEHHVVLAVENDDLDPIPVAAPTELFGAAHPGKSSS